MIAVGRRSNTCCTAAASTSSATVPVPWVSTMTETGSATPMA